MSDHRVTMVDIARLAEVMLPAVSNWRRRHETFPRADRRNGEELFLAAAVARWLDGRKIAKNDLKGNEIPGTSYGARFRNNLGIAAIHDPGQEESLWKELNRFRGAEDIAMYADLVLGLMYLSVREQNRWVDIATAEDRASAKLVELAILEHEHVRALFQLHRAWRSVLIGSGGAERLGHIVRVIDRIRQSGQARGSSYRRWAGDVFEYLLNRFAAAEGKRGAVVVTPMSVGRVLVELIALKPGDSVLDPCTDSGGFLLAAAKYIETHGGRTSDISFAGQAILERSWSLTRMNLDLHGIPADLGKQPGIALNEDLHSGKRFDVVLANPPFNMSDWGSTQRAGSRWRFGDPPRSNANLAWLQHIWSSLAEGGRAAVVMANGALSSEQAKEKLIRAAMVEEGAVEVLIALPPQLFATTAIPVTAWLLRRPGAKRRDEMLFVDARNLGTMISRTQRDLLSEDIRRIADTVLTWRDSGNRQEYRDIPGFSASVPIQEIRKHGYQLAPGRYVGTAITSGTFTESVVELRHELDRLHLRATEIDAIADRQLNRIARWIP